MRFALFVAAFALAACSSQPDYRAADTPPETVESVDLSRYQGLWYEIARYPNGFEDKDAYRCVGVTAEYDLNEEGTIAVTNTCRKDSLDGEIDVAEGTARVVGGDGSKLKVKFAPRWVPFAAGDYWILALTENYSAALVGDPDGKYLWILSRTPTLAESVDAELRAAATRLGYETAPLKDVPQPPASGPGSR